MVLKCDIFVLRHLLIMSTIWLQAIGCGVLLAYPCVIKENLTTNGTDFLITSEQSSWLASCVGVSGIFGFIVFSALLQIIGRKFVHITIVSVQLLSWIACYFARSVTWLFVGRFLHGMIFGVTYINSVLIGEYTSPQSRGYYTTLTKMALSLGFMICHGLSFWSFREPATAGIILSSTAIILNLFWPETPAHCAMKGRMEECEKSFIWLNGSSPEKKKELFELISAQMINRKISTRTNLCTLLKAMKERDFFKSILLASLLTLAIDLCGRYFVVAFITQIMIDMVGTGTVVYYAIFIDILSATAFLVACVMMKYMKRRTILFIFGSVSGLLMLAVNLVLFLKSKGIGSNIAWVTPFLIIMHSFVNNLGVISVSFTLFGEIFPLYCKSLCSCMSGIVFCILYGINLKISPIMLRVLGIGGTYGAFGVCLLLTLFALYFIVIETKDKTLQQIEDEMKGVIRNTDYLTEQLKEIKE